MMKYRIDSYTFAAIIFLFLSSCTEKLVDRYENGKVRLKCELKDGLRHGICKEYYPSGVLKEYGEWEEGALNGIRERYDSVGNLSVRSTFKNGTLDGISEIYESGKLKEKYINKNDLPNGKYFIYYENGNIKIEGFAKNGVREGKHKYYREDGSLSSIQEFINRDGEIYLNQYWVYDQNENLIIEKSSFLDIFIDSYGLKIELVAPFLNGQTYFIQLDTFKKITEKDRKNAVEMENRQVLLNISEFKLDTLRGCVEEIEVQKYQDSTVIQRRQIYIQYPDSNYIDI